MRRVIATGLLALVTACADEPRERAAGERGEERPSGHVGAPAPGLEAETLDGQAASLASLRGTPVLLNVWATWCHPCQDEIPVLEALHQAYDGRGLEVIGVTIDDENKGTAIRDFAKRFGMTYPVWHDPDQRVMAAFSVVGVPTSFLISRSGRVLWRKTGEVKAGDPALQAAIDSALAATE